MLTEFVGLQLSREELLEIQRALLAQAFVGDTLRKEKDLPENHDHALLQKIEGLLGDSDETLHALDHEVEEEMWEYAWFAFTDEWAWYRATQVVMADQGKAYEALSEPERDRLIELVYKKQFDAFVAEVDMREFQAKKRLIGQAMTGPQTPGSKPR